jgi:hypothetical protein
VPRNSAHAKPSKNRAKTLSLVGAAVVVALGLLSLGTAQALTLRSAPVAPNSAPSVAAAHVALVDHGGAVLPAATVHAIWWGPTADFPADERVTVEAELAALNHSSYLAVASQYLRGAAATATFSRAHAWADTSAPTAGPVTADTLAAEVTKYLTATGQQPSATAIYLVFTSTGVTGAECAWHSARQVTANGASALAPVAYLPNATGVEKCDTGIAVEGTSAAATAVAASVAHEIIETQTDVIPGAAWTAADGDEIGDVCASDLRLVTLQGGLTLPLQAIWSNTTNSCAISA